VGLSQPALAQSLQRIEAELRAQILERYRAADDRRDRRRKQLSPSVA